MNIVLPVCSGSLRDSIRVAHGYTKTAITPDWADYAPVNVKASRSAILTAETTAANHQTHGRPYNILWPTDPRNGPLRKDSAQIHKEPFTGCISYTQPAPSDM